MPTFNLIDSVIVDSKHQISIVVLTYCLLYLYSVHILRFWATKLQ